MQDRRAVVAFVAFLLVIVGGGMVWKSTQSSSKATIDSSHDAVPTTAPSTTSTTAANSTDWNAVIGHLASVENDLFVHPDPTRVSEIMLPTCSCYAQTQQSLGNLKSKGWHVRGDSETIKSVHFITGNDQASQVLVLPNVTGNPTVDAKGVVVSPGQTGTAQSLVYVLKKGTDGVWRLTDRHLTAELKQ